MGSGLLFFCWSFMQKVKDSGGKQQRQTALAQSMKNSITNA